MEMLDDQPEAMENEKRWYSFHQVKNTISHPGLLYEVNFDGTPIRIGILFRPSFTIMSIDRLEILIFLSWFLPRKTMTPGLGQGSL